jgi:hypothetical protein
MIWDDMLWGVVIGCMILPIWAIWLSNDRIRLGQKGIVEPFILGLLAGISGSIGLIVRGIETVGEIALCVLTGIAVLVVIVKSIRGTLITKKEAEED